MASSHDHDALGEGVFVGVNLSDQEESSHVDHSGCAGDPGKILAQKNVFSKRIHSLNRTKT